MIEREWGLPGRSRFIH